MGGITCEVINSYQLCHCLRVFAADQLCKNEDAKLVTKSGFRREQMWVTGLFKDIDFAFPYLTKYEGLGGVLIPV